MFLVSNCVSIYVYEFFIDICLYCVLFEIKFLFSLLVFFPHKLIQLGNIQVDSSFYLKLGNIQVDSIKLLSTLATDG